MIIYRKYGKKIEITKLQKTPISRGRIILNSTKVRGIVGVRRFDSIRRTKRVCMRKLLSAIEKFGAPLLFTLTFQGSASDILLSSKKLSYFQRRLRIEYPRSHTLFVPELSSRGRIHYHGLVFGVPQEWGDIKKGKHTLSFGRERAERKFARLWGYGFIDILQTDGSPRLAGYITKYVAKGVGEPFFAPIRLIRTSKGFPDAEVYRFEDDNFDYLFQSRLPSPSFECSSYSPFFGRISKSFYDLD